MKPNNIKFAFLVHPRGVDDIRKKYFFAKFIPAGILKLVIKFLNPRVASIIKGLKDKKGNEIRGLIIAVLLTPSQMLSLKRSFVQKKIIKAIKLAEKKGAKIVGLGAFTSSVTNGGLDLVGKTKIGITNGNSLTAAVALEDIAKIIRKNNLSIENDKFAIVGATGSIGSLVAKSLAKNGCKNILLVGRTPENLEKLKREIKKINQICEAMTSVQISDIKKTDLIILATAASAAVIKPEYLKTRSIIYDITQPANIDKNVFEKNDAVIIKGGLIKTPGIDYHLDFGLPKETAFACLTETMLLSRNYKFKNFSLGKANSDQAQEIYYLFKESAFRSNYAD